MTALYHYVVDNALIYPAFSSVCRTVYTTDIAAIYYREGYSALGGSDYYLD